MTPEQFEAMVVKRMRDLRERGIHPVQRCFNLAQSNPNTVWGFRPDRYGLQRHHGKLCCAVSGLLLNSPKKTGFGATDPVINLAYYTNISEYRLWAFIRGWDGRSIPDTGRRWHQAGRRAWAAVKLPL